MKVTAAITVHLVNKQTACMHAQSLLLCLTLCDPMDCSLPASSVHGILQARTLEWVAISFSNARKWNVKVKSLSRVWLLATPWTAAHQAPPIHGIFQARVLEWGAIAFSQVALVVKNPTANAGDFRNKEITFW